MKKKTTIQLSALELVVIGTLLKHPETFRQVRDIMRLEMFVTAPGLALAEVLFPMLSAGTFNSEIFAATIDGSMMADLDAIKQSADPDNLRAAAEMLSGEWADAEYFKTVGEVAMSHKDFEDWRQADETLNETKRRILHMSGGKVASPKEVIGGIMSDLWDGLTNHRTYTGIPTGFPDLDSLVGGWRPGQQIVVGARPGTGKTRLALQFAYTAAKHGFPTVFYSLEIFKENIYKYLLSYMSLVRVQDMNNYELRVEEADAISECSKMLETLPLYVVDDVFSLEDLLFSAREIAGQKNVALIVVDYLQQLSKTSTRRTDNRNNELSEISRATKQLARQTNAATIVLSQLNREVERRGNRRPILADLRDSGAIEADADVILFPYRPSEDSPDPCELIIGKQRDGLTASVEVQWKDPGFFYSPSPIATQPFDPSLNGRMKPALVNGTDIPF